MIYTFFHYWSMIDSPGFSASLISMLVVIQGIRGTAGGWSVKNMEFYYRTVFAACLGGTFNYF